MQSVCVFCGSSLGSRPEYVTVAAELGAELARRGLTLIYGGGNIGLMGRLADAALAAGGRVVGVIPRALVDREVAHTGLTELQIVGSMHERKARMAETADAFLALPGGIGTLEELCEILTWAQLGIHNRPIALINTANYFSPLIRMLDHAVEEGFIRPRHRRLLIVEPTVGEALKRCTVWVAPTVHAALPPEAT